MCLNPHGVPSISDRNVRDERASGGKVWRVQQLGRKCLQYPLAPSRTWIERLALCSSETARQSSFHDAETHSHFPGSCLRTRETQGYSTFSPTKLNMGFSLTKLNISLTTTRLPFYEEYCARFRLSGLIRLITGCQSSQGGAFCVS